MLRVVPHRSTIALAAALAVILAPMRACLDSYGGAPSTPPRRSRSVARPTRTPPFAALAGGGPCAGSLLRGGPRERARHPHRREDLEPERRAAALREGAATARERVDPLLAAGGMRGGRCDRHELQLGHGARGPRRGAHLAARPAQHRVQPLGDHDGGGPRARPRARPRPRATPLRADEHPARDALPGALHAAARALALALPHPRARRRARRRAALRGPREVAWPPDLRPVPRARHPGLAGSGARQPRRDRHELRAPARGRPRRHT